MQIKITADSTCDLSQELISKHNITITPLYLLQGDDTYQDGVDITPEDFFDYFEKTGQLSTTAAVNVQDYLDVFRPLLGEYDAIIHFTISASMSSCYQNACIAAKECGNVFVVNSQSLSSGIGHLVMDAAQMATKGIPAEEIVACLEEKKDKLDVSFVVDTLEYLRKGGRCSAVAAFGANLLRLKPCIEVKNGAMGVGKKYRGTLANCLAAYVKDRLSDPETVDPSRLFITDSGVSPEIYQCVLQEVNNCMHFETVEHTLAGGTISSHCGPNCLGILFYRK